MEPSILSLLPPVVTIGLAIATRRILLALGIGVVLGALMYSQWNILDSVSLIAEVAGGLIIAEGAIAEEMYILAFVVLLGVLTSFIYISGGLRMGDHQGQNTLPSAAGPLRPRNRYLLR
jgi:tetracycline resistance efflux pump